MEVDNPQFVEEMGCPGAMLHFHECFRECIAISPIEIEVAIHIVLCLETIELVW